ncbi:MAG: hypothetical protein KDE19_05280 [Caldilineaceae bacterium]|nr:hypothetical protein [Caldilineaceae bacterium]
MTELEQGQAVTATLSSPDEKHHYFFVVPADEPMTLHFTAPPSAYAVTFVQKAFPLDKEGGAVAHSDDVISLTTETYQFAESSPKAVYLSVASANGSTVPSADYTIQLAGGGQ